MNRQYLRVAALAVFLYLSLAPVASAAPRRDRDLILDPGDRIVRIIKKVKNFFRGISSQDDYPLPPRP
ncbi:MAG: hypothetical protein ACJ74H_11345 [Thermoanaerobaculia bacterium]